MNRPLRLVGRGCPQPAAERMRSIMLLVARWDSAPYPPEQIMVSIHVRFWESPALQERVSGRRG